ncbi:MAG: outer membrane protein transport protein [Bacteroidales bacterium]|nr:outer membrane protein transport protein [Bacteroidales bacterium]MCF8333702.1 outer membrane protein transport protein [Bacteroidales bacterium]
MNKRIKRIINHPAFFMAFLFVGFAPLSAQEVFDLKGAGARAAGMGYAFIGVADDATASSWNPGGLTQLDNVDISTVMDYTFDDYYKYDYINDPSDYEYGVSMQQRIDLNYASLVIPIQFDTKKLALGLSVQNYINYKWAYEQPFVENEFSYESRYNKIQIYSATFSMAYTLSNALSLGLSTNYYFSLANEIGGTYYASPESNYRGKYLGYNGLNFTMGMLLDMDEAGWNIPIRLGGRLSTPYTLESEVELQDYASGTFTDGWEMPMIAGVGMSILLGNNLTLAADYDVRFLEDKHSYYYGEMYDYRYDANTNFPYDKDEWYYYEQSKEDAMTPIVETNENISQLRLGMEYNIPLKLSSLPLRVGYKTNPTTSANINPDGTTGELASGTSIHFGIGFSTPKFTFDLAYTDFTYMIENQNVDSEQPSNFDQYEYTQSKSSIIASLIIYLGRDNEPVSDDINY